VAFGIAYDVLLVAFGVGVWGCAGPKRSQRIVAALLIAIATIGAFWPPMHMRGSPATLTDTLHVVWASVISLLILLAIAFGVTVLGKAFRVYSIASLGALLVAGALTFSYAPALAAGLPTPWLGLVERINLGLYLLWVAVLATGLIPVAAARPRADGGKRTSVSLTNQTGRAVVAGAGRAEVAAAARAVATAHDVEQLGGVAVGVRAEGDRGAGLHVDGVHAGDERRRDARAAEDHPGRAAAPDRPEDRDAGVGIRDR
jgi:hypothetical protein